jgi:hypothetical protein
MCACFQIVKYQIIDLKLQWKEKCVERQTWPTCHWLPMYDLDKMASLRKLSAPLSPFSNSTAQKTPCEADPQALRVRISACHNVIPKALSRAFLINCLPLLDLSSSDPVQSC